MILIIETSSGCSEFSYKVLYVSNICLRNLSLDAFTTSATKTTSEKKSAERLDYNQGEGSVCCLLF